MCNIFDDNLISERDEENTYSRIDPMLDEASLWMQVDHEIKSNVHGLHPDDNFSSYCASSLGEVSTFYDFQLEMKSDLVDVKDQLSHKKKVQ